MGEWQPIDSAPRHGDLLLHNVTGGWVKIGRFYSSGNDQSLWFKSDYGSHLKPTHWQPLPAPPK